MLSKTAERDKKAAYEVVQKTLTRQLPPGKTFKTVFKEFFVGEPPILDINATIDETSFTPLSSACFLGFFDEVVELIKLGAKADVPSPNGNLRPLDWAISNGQEKTAKCLLIQDGGLANLKSDKGITPLMRAAEVGSFEIVKLLVERFDADLYAKDEFGRTAVDYAVSKEKYPIESYLRYREMDSKLDKKQSPKKANKI